MAVIGGIGALVFILMAIFLVINLIIYLAQHKSINHQMMNRRIFKIGVVTLAGFILMIAGFSFSGDSSADNHSSHSSASSTVHKVHHYRLQNNPVVKKDFKFNHIDFESVKSIKQQNQNIVIVFSKDEADNADDFRSNVNSLINDIKRDADYKGIAFKAPGRVEKNGNNVGTYTLITAYFYKDNINQTIKKNFGNYDNADLFSNADAYYISPVDYKQESLKSKIPAVGNKLKTQADKDWYNEYIVSNVF